MKARTWTPLNEGDLVDIVAPGMKPLPGVKKNLKKLFKSWNLRCRFSSDLMGYDLICANSKELRAKDLKRALTAKDSSMVWCLRGGYGSLALLPELRKIKKASPKIFMGLSDITSLHTFLNQNWGWSTIHGPHLDRFALDLATSAEVKRCHDVIFAKKRTLNYKIKPLNGAAKKKGLIRSSLVGGNLITLQSSFATSFELKAQNKILFFEEIGERAYKVDRVFEQMRQMSFFKGAKAIVFGQFTGAREPSGQNLVPRLLSQFAESQKIPVFSGIKSGHGSNQHPLPFNTPCLLTKGLKANIEISTGVKG